ncbi:hypothetical protein ACFIJ5_05180 [Haloimpatiens sp. FM7330]|uniref:hypothetical protein n=1 Tax=Haloimpatiens sp. FM7330 TaxID=3298610 RepID=UPI0036457191
MKTIIKKMCCFICSFILLIGLVGCGKTSQSIDKKSNEKVEKTKKYNKELASLFPFVEGTVLRYSGTLEHMHTLTLNKVIDGDVLKLNFKGQIEDLSEGETKKDLTIEEEYIIDKDSVKQVKSWQSIINEQVVLKLPIKKGNVWKQKVIIKGKEYEAETKIVDISKDEKNKNMVKTETIVKGIKNYPQNTYKEIKVYKQDKGLVEFTNTILLEGKENEKPTSMEFGYHLFEPEKSK